MRNTIKQKIAKVVKSYNAETLKIGYCSRLRKYHKYLGTTITSGSNNQYLTAFIGTYDKNGIRVD